MKFRFLTILILAILVNTAWADKSKNPLKKERVLTATPSTPDLDQNDDTGSSNSDNITSKTTSLKFTGTAGAGNIVTLFEGANVLGSVNATGGGNWTITVASLSAGTYNIQAIANDGTTDSSPSGALVVTIDTSSPAPSTPDLAAADDSGFSNSDNTTNVTTGLTFSGTSEANASIELFDGVTSLGTTSANGAGAWTIDLALAAASYSITAVATDAAGNVSAASAALLLTIDTTAPASASAADLASADDSGSSNSDDVTNTTTNLTFTGTAPANVRIELFNGATSLGTTTSNGSGNWSKDVNLTENIYSITVVASDDAGNASAASGALALTIDTTAPAAPSTPDLAAADDSGSSNSDNRTKNTTGLTISGTSEADASIQLYNGVATLGSAFSASGGGAWTSDFALSQNTYSITAKATDAAGNTSASSSALALVVDTTAPTLSTLSPLDDAANVPTNTSFVMTFNENMAVSGTSASGTEDNFQVNKTSGSVLTIDVARASGDVSVSGTQVTVVNSGADLGLNVGYHVNIGNKVFSDVAGNDYIGIGTIAGLGADNTTWNFTTSAGATITAPSITTCSTSYTALGDIVIDEGAGNDINASSGGSYTLILQLTNAGYRFKPSVGSISFTAAKDIASAVVTSITATSATFTLTFDASGSGGTNRARNDIDKITISGLEVSSDGVAASTSDVVMSNSATIPIPAVVAGTTAFGTITQGSASATPDFYVQALPGDPGVDPAQTAFSTSSSGVILKSSQAGGVFSGNGVVYNNSLNEYTFNPSATGVGSFDITYTYSAVGQCPASVTKTFVTFFSNIGGLSSSYCSNAAGTTMTVSSTYLNNNYSGWSYITYIYYDPNTGSLTIPGQNDLFDPKSSIYDNTRNLWGGAYVGFDVYNSSNLLIGREWTFVTIKKIPNVSFNISPNNFCDNGALVDLIQYASPAPGIGDIFSGEGVNNPTRKFNPTTVTTKGSLIDLTYKYTDPATNCFNTAIAQVIVNVKPVAVAPSQMYLYFANTSAGNPVTTYACENNSFDYIVSAANQNPIYPNDFKYNFYSNSNLSSNSLMYSQSWFFYPYTVQTNVIGTTNFYVTQTENSCESDPLTIKATVNKTPALTTAQNSMTICATDDVTLSTFGVNVVAPATSATTTWSTTGDGQFWNGNTLVGSTAVMTSATRYVPGTTDKANQFVNLILTTTDTDGPSQPCTPAVASFTITINSAPVANAGADMEFCANDKVLLSGTVTGGSIATEWTLQVGSGGTIGDKNALFTDFAPSIAQKNNGANLTFRLTTADPDGGGPCQVSYDEVNIAINQEALIDAGPDAAYCSDETITLAGTKPTGSGATSWTWSGGAGSFSDNTVLAPTYSFTPAEIGNTLLFTLTTTDPDGAGPCLAKSDQVSIRIKQDPAAPTISSPILYCQTPGLNVAVEPLSAGSNVTWYTNPLLNGTGAPDPFSPPVTRSTDSKTTYYATATLEGCESDATPVDIIVNPVPTPDFTMLKFCEGDFTEFTDQSSLTYHNGGTGTLTSWKWDFTVTASLQQPPSALPGDAVNTPDPAYGGTYQNPAYKYPATGNYNAKVTVLSSDGCEASKTLPLRIGPVPAPSFTVSDVCEGDDTKFAGFAGAAAQSEPNLSWDWDFGDGGTSTDKDPTHLFAQFATQLVKLTVTTAAPLNCQGTTQKEISILPYLNALTDFPYNEGFESSTHGWAKQAVVINGAPSDSTSWQFPNKFPAFVSGGFTEIDRASEGSNAWYTAQYDNTNTWVAAFRDEERSILDGPCFDLTKLERPLISFDFWNGTEEGFDGAYLEVSTNGGATWAPLGQKDQGIDWYNRSGVVGLQLLQGVGQAVNQQGWSGQTHDWHTAKFSLDQFKDQTKVRIRYVFGSNKGNAEAVAGFAIDNFKIKSRNRSILLENYTNTGKAENNEAYSNFMGGATSAEFVKIEYHSAFQANDVLNSQNSVDPNARVAFYGLTNSATNIPRAFIDGYSDGSFVTAPLTPSPDLWAQWAQNRFSTRTLVDSYFEIQPSTIPLNDPGAGAVHAQVTIKALEAVPAGNLKLFVAVVEQDVVVDGETFMNVVRKMLPNAAGTSLPAMAKDEVLTFNDASLLWRIDNNSIDPSKIAIVAFVQDQNTKEVYQAAMNGNPGNLPNRDNITGVEYPDYGKHVMVFPNPTINEEVHVVLPELSSKAIPLHMTDNFGRDIASAVFKPGEKQKTLNTKELSAGVYFIQIQTEKGLVVKKVMVQH